MNYFQTSYTVSMEIQRVVAENVFRMRGKLSRQKLAKLAGVSYQHIYEIEEKITVPSLKVLDKISKALNVEVSDLLKSDVKTVAIIEKEPVSIFAKKLLAIPDDIYELAQDIRGNEEAWESVRGTIRGEIKIAKSKIESQGSAKNHS